MWSYKILSGIKIMLEMSIIDYDYLMNPIKDSLQKYPIELSTEISIFDKECVNSHHIADIPPVFVSLTIGIDNLLN